MRVFVDASAIVAMIAKEPEARSFATYLLSYDERLTSPLAVWEAVRGVERVRGVSLSEARTLVDDFVLSSELRVVPIDAADAPLALDAHERFGKGNHPASLNFGDCFAYVCTIRHGAELMFKGKDFIQTDIRDAMLP